MATIIAAAHLHSLNNEYNAQTETKNKNEAVKVHHVSEQPLPSSYVLLLVHIV